MDIEVLLWLQEIRQALSPALDFILANLSDLFSHAATLMPFVIYWAFNKKHGRFLLCVLSVSFMLNQAAKAAACVYRPWIRDSRVIPSENALTNATGYSFPSGHSQVSAAEYGGFGLLRRENRKIFSSMIFLFLLSGFLRCFLGVHTPQDVLCGITLGLLSVFAAHVIWPRVRTGSNDRKAVILWAAVCVISASWVILKKYPLDYADGLLLCDPAAMIKDSMGSIGLSAAIVLGGYLERRYVNFSVNGTVREKVIRVLAGAAGTGLIYLTVKFGLAPFLPASAGNFLKAFLAVLFAVWLYPLILVRFFPNKKVQ